MKFPIHPALYDRLKKLKLLHPDMIRDVFIKTTKKELQMDQEEKRPLHHVIISELTDNLGTAVRNLENLADEIEGHPMEEQKDTEQVAEIGKDASLAQFLDHYPKKLETLNKRVTEATDRLRKLLF